MDSELACLHIKVLLAVSNTDSNDLIQMTSV